MELEAAGQSVTDFESFKSVILILLQRLTTDEFFNARRPLEGWTWATLGQGMRDLEQLANNRNLFEAFRRQVEETENRPVSISDLAALAIDDLVLSPAGFSAEEAKQVLQNIQGTEVLPLATSLQDLQETARQIEELREVTEAETEAPSVLEESTLVEAPPQESALLQRFRSGAEAVKSFAEAHSPELKAALGIAIAGAIVGGIIALKKKLSAKKEKILQAAPSEASVKKLEEVLQQEAFLVDTERKVEAGTLSEAESAALVDVAKSLRKSERLMSQSRSRAPSSGRLTQRKSRRLKSRSPSRPVKKKVRVLKPKTKRIQKKTLKPKKLRKLKAKPKAKPKAAAPPRPAPPQPAAPRPAPRPAGRRKRPVYDATCEQVMPCPERETKIAIVQQ